MEWIIQIAIIIFVVMSVCSSKKKKEKLQKADSQNAPSYSAATAGTVYQAPTHQSKQQQAKQQKSKQQQAKQHQSKQQQAKQAQAQKKNQQRAQNQQKNQAQKMRQAAAPNIMDRAKANNTRFDNDTTLEEIEKLHGHKEQAPEFEFDHSRNCQTNLEGEGVEAMESHLPSVEDLLVKGYDGNMNFDRDFIAEGTDMIAEFTLSNELI